MWFRSLLIASVGILMLLDSSGATAQWHYNTSRDELDDTITDSAFGFGTGGFMGVVCQQQSPKFRISLIPYRLSFHISDSVEVKYRFDNGKAGEEYWGWNKSATINAASAYKFADMLMNRNNLIIKIEGGDTMKFSLKGSRAVIAKVIAACQR